MDAITLIHAGPPSPNKVTDLDSSHVMDPPACVTIHDLQPESNSSSPLMDSSTSCATHDAHSAANALANGHANLGQGQHVLSDRTRNNANLFLGSSAAATGPPREPTAGGS
eukprot:jgi/Chrzof1/4375/Cz14g10250.t1